MTADQVTVTVKNAGRVARATRTRTLYSTPPRLDPHVAPRPAAVPVDARHRVGDGRRERRQLPLPEPLLRDEPGAERRRARRDPGAQPGHPVGEHDRRRLERRRLLRRHLGRPARDQREGGDLQHGARARHLRGARPAGARRLAVGLRVGHRPRRGRARASSARRTCRSCSATTTSRTPTTATGCRTPSSRWRASTASSATSAPSARCARGRACDGRAAAGRHRRLARATATRSSSCRTPCSTNRQYAGELWRDELAAFCEATPDDDRAPAARWT